MIVYEKTAILFPSLHFLYVRAYYALCALITRTTLRRRDAQCNTAESLSVELSSLFHFVFSNEKSSETELV